MRGHSKKCVTVIQCGLVSVNLLTLVVGGLVAWLGYTIPIRLKQFGLSPDWAISCGFASLFVAWLGLYALNYSSHYALNVYGIPPLEDNPTTTGNPGNALRATPSADKQTPAAHEMPSLFNATTTTLLMNHNSASPAKAGSTILDVIRFVLIAILLVLVYLALVLANHLRQQERHQENCGGQSSKSCAKVNDKIQLPLPISINNRSPWTSHFNQSGTTETGEIDLRLLAPPIGATDNNTEFASFQMPVGHLEGEQDQQLYQPALLGEQRSTVVDASGRKPRLSCYCRRCCNRTCCSRRKTQMNCKPCSVRIRNHQAVSSTLLGPRLTQQNYSEANQQENDVLFENRSEQKLIAGRYVDSGLYHRCDSPNSDQLELQRSSSLVFKGDEREIENEEKEEAVEGEPLDTTERMGGEHQPRSCFIGCWEPSLQSHKAQLIEHAEMPTECDLDIQDCKPTTPADAWNTRAGVVFHDQQQQAAAPKPPTRCASKCTCHKNQSIYSPASFGAQNTTNLSQLIYSDKEDSCRLRPVSRSQNKLESQSNYTLSRRCRLTSRSSKAIYANGQYSTCECRSRTSSETATLAFVDKDVY